MRNAVSVAAHGDGRHILLEEPVGLELGSKLSVIILPKGDAERRSWLRLSEQRLEDAYGEDEDEYQLDSIKEANPAYERR